MFSELPLAQAGANAHPGPCIEPCRRSEAIVKTNLQQVQPQILPHRFSVSQAGQGTAQLTRKEIESTRPKQAQRPDCGC